MKSNTVDSVRAGYARIATHFATTRGVLWEEVRAMCDAIRPGDRVLDVGCGSGRLYPEIVLRQGIYTGVDVTEELLAEAHARHPGGTLIRDDMRTLNQVTEEFDHIFFIASLHHLSTHEDRLQALRAAKRLLVRGGKLHITVWNLYQPRFFSRHVAAFFDRSRARGDVIVPWKNPDGTVQAQRYYHAFTKPELVQLVQEAGFTVNSVWYACRGVTVPWYRGYNLCLTATSSDTPSSHRILSAAC